MRMCRREATEVIMTPRSLVAVVHLTFSLSDELAPRYSGRSISAATPDGPVRDPAEKISAETGRARCCPTHPSRSLPGCPHRLAALRDQLWRGRCSCFGA